MESVARIGTTVPASASRSVSPLGELGLVVGQTLRARVTRVEGDTVQLQWGDQAVSVASRIPLSLGQQVSLLVEEGSSGKMLLRMIDETFGKGRPTRSAGGQPGGPAPTSSSPGRTEAPASAPGWGAPLDDVMPGDVSFWGTDGDPEGAGGPQAQLPNIGPRFRPVGNATPEPARPPISTNTPLPNGPRPAPGATTGLATSGSLNDIATPENLTGLAMPRSLPGLATPIEGDSLAALAFEMLDGADVRLASPARPGAADRPLPGPTSGPAAGGVVARSAMPTYGKLAQSIGGATAFGQLMATLGHDIGQTLARAPLAPADIGKLLIEVGLHPDETNTAIVSEMLAQGVAVNESSVRRLRRGLSAAGGTPRDATPTVALGRLGLPITPLSLAIARQMQAGQLDPKAAWGELLGELQTLARGGGHGSQASMLATELLADWRVPFEDGADGIARWLRAAVDQAATPLEAKLTRSLANQTTNQEAATSPGQDVRARLDMVAQALPPSTRAERGPLTQALQRTQATIQAEQFLNGSSNERVEQRFFAVTLPTVMNQQPSTLELRVRERDAQPRRKGEVAQPDIVQMKLSLPGLGDLGVNLMVGQHSVSCHFSAGSAFAEALLNASSSELVGRLRRLGFAHTAVDAAHESIPTTAPLAAAPRVNHVDAKA